MSPAAPPARRVVALAGRPNTGKTTLFNALTGLRQRTANYAGCTVEKAVGTALLGAAEAEIVDLPGTFSLVPATEDEKVSFRFLSEGAREAGGALVVCVAEASQLANDLGLACGLLEAGHRVVVAVNMIDEARENGVRVDAEALSRELGAPVVALSARTGEGMSALREALARPETGPAREPLDLSRAPRGELARLQMRAIERAHAACARAVTFPSRPRLATVARSLRLDAAVLHPLAGPLLLAAAVFVIFQALFLAAQPLMDLLSDAFLAGAARLAGELPPGPLSDLLCQGVLPGVAAVAVFVPQIAILFTVIGVLEQSGYLPRAAAIVDRALRPFGLDGRVFIPFLSGFACAIPGVMAARTIPDERRRLTAILLTPLMTCSARLPVYTLLVTAFVPAGWRPAGLSGRGAVMAALYAFGVAAALLLAFLLKHTSLHQPDPLPVTLLPSYRLPAPGELARYVWARCWHFLSRAGRTIFAIGLLLWALSSFPRRAPVSGEPPERAAAEQVAQSALGRLGRAVEPVFRPLGWDWKISVAVLSSLAAREVFVGTLGTIHALGSEAGSSEGLAAALRRARGPDGAPLYTAATAAGLLVFFAIAVQCVSTIAVVRRETGGWTWPAAQFTGFFALAYALALAASRLTAALTG